MVSIAAFLIILVILFGLEEVRSFVFGTFGFLAWVAIILIGIGSIVSWEESTRKARKEAREAEKKENAALKQAKLNTKRALVELKKSDKKAYNRVKRPERIFIWFCLIPGILVAATAVAMFLLNQK